MNILTNINQKARKTQRCDVAATACKLSYYNSQ